MSNPGPNAPIRIVIVDDHHLFRLGVRAAIESRDDMILVGEGENGADVFPLIIQHRPHVLILDMGMRADDTSEERFNALDCIEKLRYRFPSLRIIVVTQNAVPILVEGAMESGVQGFVLKGDRASLDLGVVIEGVSRGGVFVSESLSDLVFGRGSNDMVELTPRQTETLAMAAIHADASTAEPAVIMSLSEGTVKKHLQSAYRALGVTSRAGGIIRAMQLGLLPLVQTGANASV